jgi:hypothetical protein
MMINLKSVLWFDHARRNMTHTRYFRAGEAFFRFYEHVRKNALKETQSVNLSSFSGQ